jgi:N-acetylglutamate synthase-like GNAT family acetyltransferase
MNNSTPSVNFIVVEETLEELLNVGLTREAEAKQSPPRQVFIEPKERKKSIGTSLVEVPRKKAKEEYAAMCSKFTLK